MVALEGNTVTNYKPPNKLGGVTPKKRTSDLKGINISFLFKTKQATINLLHRTYVKINNFFATHKYEIQKWVGIAMLTAGIAAFILGISLIGFVETTALALALIGVCVGGCLGVDVGFCLLFC